MSHTAEIAYLNSVKDDNDTKIARNASTITALDAAIAGNLAANVDFETQKTDLDSQNTALAADNVMIDTIIALL